MVKQSSTKVEAAPVSTMKPLKKDKRESEDDSEIQVTKKQKKALIPAKAVPNKVESSSSDSSDSEEEVKADNSSEDDSSSDDEPAPSKKQPEPLKKAKAETSSDSEDESSSDDEPAPEKKQPEPLEKVKAETSSKDESSDEEPAPSKKQPEPLEKVKAESSSDDESSSDEETVPEKKQPTVVKQAKAEKSSSDDESSSDEETAPVVKKQLAAPKNAEAEKSSADDESSSDDEPTPAKKPTVVKNAKPAAKDSSSSDEDSDDEESDDEKPPTKKAKVSVTKTSNQESSSDESDEESEDEKVTPKKKDSDIEMVEAEQKPTAEQPKTPTTQTQAGSKTVFVGNLSYQVQRSDVENFFKDVTDVRFTLDEEGRPKGYGHVEFATAEAAQKALELNGTSLLGRNVRLDLARERSTLRSSAGNYQSGEKGAGSQNKTIFVKGFNVSMSEDEIKSDLRAHFGTCGEVSRIVLPQNPDSGVFKGIAFIDLNDGYYKALQLKGSEIRGRKLDVQEGRPRGSSGDDSNGGRFSNNKRGRGPRGGRDSNRGVRGPRGGRSRGRGPPPGRGPSKPSVIASAQGKKTVFNDDE